jgi:epoxyqueuosine reductase
MLTADEIKIKARSLGFDLCGIAPAAGFTELEFLETWLDNGYAGEMQYMSRTASRRADVRQLLPSARTVVALGTVYNTQQPYSTERADPDEAGIARYAWGADYHDVVGQRTRTLLKWMQDASPETFEAKAYVDTGPVQERVYAQYAGLGWIGKNTCVINPDLGSWLFLSEIICSLPLETDAPALDQCGTCTLCLEACPTDAFVEPWVLDATRCISYVTIELKDAVPESSRIGVGSHVYGCDVCQDVCPWNADAAQSSDDCWQPQAVFDRPRLIDLWQQPDEVLGPIVSHSALSHTGLLRLRRNIAVALGNAGSDEAVKALAEPVADESKRDPLVGSHVQWARNRVEKRGRDRVMRVSREPSDQ